jgi:phage terminase large subunit-like protein
MPPTDRKLELKAKTSLAQTASQAAVYAKGLTQQETQVFQFIMLYTPRYCYT